MKVMAIDPGEKRIGLALSDPMGIIAHPLGVVNHVSRIVDAAVIAELAIQHAIELIIVGQALDDEGEPGYQARKSQRLAEAICQQSSIPVILWDESSSTHTARQVSLETGVKKKNRRGHLDDVAASVILQDYLDANEDRRK